MSENPGIGSLVLARARLADYIALTKPALTLLSVATALSGAYLSMAAGQPALGLLHVFAGTLMVGGGAGALNQYLERRCDGLMRRTSGRPLPAGRIGPREALAFGLTLGIGGVLYLLVFTTLLAAALAALTLIIYLALYTPMKRMTPFAVLIGGIPGALPPVIGWTAIQGDLSMGGWSLFFILFFWQMPHFMSLAWIYRRDYEAAGYRTMAVADPSGALLSRHAVLYTVALAAASLMPTLTGVAGTAYFLCASILSVGLFVTVLVFSSRRTGGRARRLFVASLIYLTSIVLLLMLERAV